MSMNQYIDLKGQMSIKGLDLIPMIDWLPPQKSMVFTPYVTNGKLRFEPNTGNDERVSFVLDSDFNLYFGVGRYYMNLKAGSVIMAGEIKCRGGKINYINNYSDAFAPGYNQFIEFVKEFRKLTFVSTVIEIEFRDFKSKTSNKINLAMESGQNIISGFDKKSQGVSENWFLFLHNDHINSKLDVVVALENHTDLQFEDCQRIMLCAHLNGTSLILQGSYTDLEHLQDKLRDSGLTTSMELVCDISGHN
jgi:ATP-dependent Clp protease adapter protein ClpS